MQDSGKLTAEEERLLGVRCVMVVDDLEDTGLELELLVDILWASHTTGLAAVRSRALGNSRVVTIARAVGRCVGGTRAGPRGGLRLVVQVYPRTDVFGPVIVIVVKVAEGRVVAFKGKKRRACERHSNRACEFEQTSARAPDTAGALTTAVRCVIHRGHPGIPLADLVSRVASTLHLGGDARHWATCGVLRQSNESGDIQKLHACGAAMVPHCCAGWQQIRIQDRRRSTRLEQG